MKKIIILLFFISSLSANTQNVNEFNNDRFNCLHSDNNRGEMTLCDSIYEFELHTNSSYLIKRDYKSYNVDGQVTVIENYTRNDDDGWQIDRRREWFYDENGLFIEFLYQKINPYTLEFENYQYDYHTFNDQNLLEIDSILGWDNITNSWFPKLKINYSFNGDGSIEIALWQDWNDVMQLWVTTYKDIYTYNSNGEIIEELSQKWDTATSEWVNFRKISYDYYDNNKMSDELWTEWNSTEESWKILFTYHYYYDENEFLVESIREYWDTESNQWINQFHYLYTNDEAGNVTEKISQYWDYINNVWYNNLKDIYYNSVHQTTDIRTVKNDSEIDIYPNPTKNFVHILNKQSTEYQLKLISANGQIMGINKVIKDKQEYLDLSGLQNGIYFLQFYSKEKGGFIKKITKY